MLNNKDDNVAPRCNMRYFLFRRSFNLPFSSQPTKALSSLDKYIQRTSKSIAINGQFVNIYMYIYLIPPNSSRIELVCVCVRFILPFIVAFEVPKLTRNDLCLFIRRLPTPHSHTGRAKTNRERSQHELKTRPA